MMTNLATLNSRGGGKLIDENRPRDLQTCRLAEQGYSEDVVTGIPRRAERSSE